MLVKLIAAATLAGLAMFGVAKAGETAEPGYYTDQKVVYHNDGGHDGPAYFKRMLGSIRNHVEALGRDHVQIRVVDHGDGVTLFKLAQANLEKYPAAHERLNLAAVQQLIVGWLWQLEKDEFIVNPLSGTNVPQLALQKVSFS